MGMGASDEGGMQAAVGDHVGEVATLTPEEPMVLHPLDTLADEAEAAGLHRHDDSVSLDGRRCRVARTTPSTIDW